MRPSLAGRAQIPCHSRLWDVWRQHGSGPAGSHLAFVHASASLQSNPYSNQQPTSKRAIKRANMQARASKQAGKEAMQEGKQAGIRASKTQTQQLCNSNTTTQATSECRQLGSLLGDTGHDRLLHFWRSARCLPQASCCCGMRAVVPARQNNKQSKHCHEGFAY